jgi:hypothetical protein
MTIVAYEKGGSVMPGAIAQKGGGARRGSAGRVTRVVRVGVMAVAAATAINDLVAAVAAAALGSSPAFAPLQVGPVTVFTMGGVALAALVFGVVSRYSRRPMRVYAPLAAGALVLSWLPDLSLYRDNVFPGTTGAGVLVLVGLHAIAALVTVLFLNTWAVEEPLADVGASRPAAVAGDASP